MTIPLVSVVLATFNAERYLPEAIESIRRQTWEDFEFIIIDDGSADGSLAVLRGFEREDARIRVISRSNTGLTRALNEGIEVSRGKYIARMDADDISLPTRFEQQVAYLERTPECVAVGCRMMRMDPDGVDLGVDMVPLSHTGIEARLLCGDGSAIPHPGVMLRRTTVEAVGMYRVKYRTAQDLDLFLRLGEYGKLANLESVLLRYREHLQSTNHLHEQDQITRANEILNEAFARRGLERCVSPRVARPRLDISLAWGWRTLAMGEVYAARKHAIQCLRMAPLSSATWRLVACTLRGY